MKNFIVICFLLFNISLVKAQSVNGSDFKSSIIAKSDTANFKIVVDSLMNVLPNKSIYLIGETHGVKANDFIFFPLIKAMHERKAVKYVIREMNHSYYFGTNLFLKYGDVKILADFDKKNLNDSLKWNRIYRGLIDLYNYNKKQPIGNRIEFIGTEFDIENIPFGRPLTSYHYITAIKYFKKYSTQKLPEAIDKIFQEIISADANDVKLLTKKDKELNQLSTLYKNELKVCFEEFYKDYYIIINSFKTYANNGRRDLGMVNSLENAYRVIKECHPNSEPKFFGSFGVAHVIPGNNGSFASKMDKSATINGGVAFIGTSYFNSSTNYTKEVKKIDKSSLGGLNNKNESIANTLLKKISTNEASPIILLSKFSGLQNPELNFLRPFDAIFIFNGF